MNKSKKGFTLIELMITVAIIGILSAIAMPKFSEYKERGDLSRARSTMNRFEGVVFQFISDNPYYAGALFDSNKVDKIKKDIQQSGGDFACEPNPSPKETKDLKTICKVTVGGFTLSLSLEDVNRDGFLTITKKTKTTNGWPSSDSCWIVDKSGNC